MRKSKSYRFKPVTVAQLETVKEMYPSISETELIEQSVNLLEGVLALSCCPSFNMYWRSLDGKRYKLTFTEE